MPHFCLTNREALWIGPIGKVPSCTKTCTFDDFPSKMTYQRWKPCNKKPKCNPPSKRRKTMYIINSQHQLINRIPIAAEKGSRKNLEKVQHSKKVPDKIIRARRVEGKKANKSRKLVTCSKEVFGSRSSSWRRFFYPCNY